MSTNTVSNIEPTPGDIAFMIQIFKHMTNKPDIDWDVFAANAGFKSAGVAQTRYSQIKRKYDQNNPTSATPRKRKTAEPSPSKVQKAPSGRVGTKGKKGKDVIKPEEDEGEDVKGRVKSEEGDAPIEHGIEVEI
ncbi:hypothetical protein CCHL11_01481 [Colletotrichum chlorophyti]|uniref:Myb-like DNA-binding domain-containing protein n=1 Tax=Colletotrichum chlorophyti TaxID=708187 RepID=A0A1Q8RXZ0_9PEZI|nr:hypothetical protein CCHL11_01481 [Colletotrichum chlorophyti]